MRQIGVLLVMGLALSACSLAGQRWDNFEGSLKKSLERPLTAAEQCEQQGGFPYGERCYEASYEVFDEEDCRLRGGLYYQEECFFPKRERVVVD